MKRVINAIIVVEGKTDVAFLSSFIDAEFVTTNGSAVPKETIDYLRQQKNQKNIIVFTDPDSPGQLIRSKLDEAIPGLKHSFVNKKDAIKNGKVGVAQTSQKRILEALNFQIETTSPRDSDLKEIDLYELGLVGAHNSTVIRNQVSAHFHLGYVNGKQLLKRARSMNLNYHQIKEFINEIN